MEGTGAPQHRFSKEQKIGIILLSAFVLLAVTLGLIEMRDTVYKPFALNNSIPALIGEDLNTPDALRYRDTDLDGLTDFDETYIYATSPYLADSDSDGITDKDEISQGKNPNCAEGKDCSTSLAGTGTTIATGDSSLSEQEELFNYTFPDNFEDLLGQPEILRQLLAESGMDQALIDQLSDQDLVSIVFEIFSSSTLMNNIENAENQVNVSSTASFINDVMNPTN